MFTNKFYASKNNYKTWKGFRLCAIDGTSIRLPDEPNIIETFGIQKGRPGQENVSMGMASTFYDCLNNIIIDSSINPNNTPERECAIRHHAFASDKDLIIYDRGYTGFQFFAHHVQHNLSFCARAKTRQDSIIKEFLASGKKEAIVKYTPNKPAIRSCTENNLPVTPITLRLVRIELPTEVEVLVTNLIDKKTYKHQVFKWLYHMRWGIEEGYKRLKQWIELENFSGKSALSVKQDFYAKIIAGNLTSLMVLASQKKVRKRSKKLKLTYQVNFAQALSKMKHHIIYILRYSHEHIPCAIKRTIDYISQSVEAVREGRSAPRRLKNIKNDIHFSAYKNAL